MKLRKYITEGGVNETDLKSSINKVLLDVNEIVSDCERAHKTGDSLGVIVTYSRASKIKTELEKILKKLR